MSDRTFDCRRHLFLPKRAALCIFAVHVATGFLLDRATKTTEDVFRLALTIVYFGAWVVLLLQSFGPRRRAIEEWMRARYAQAGPVIERDWRSFLFALDRAVTPLVFLFFILVVSVGVEVLSQWSLMAPLSIVLPLASLASSIAWMGLLAYLFLGSFLVSDVLQKYAMLAHNSSVAGVTPAPHKEICECVRRHEPVEEEMPVTILGPLEFRAGRFDWSWRDFYKNAVVFGGVGTGKTVCVLNSLLEGLIGSASDGDQATAGLILDPKGDYLEKARALCRRFGREDDLIVFSPASAGSDVCWNPFDNADSDRELAQRFAVTLESSGKKNDGDAFFVQMAQKFVAHALTLLRASAAEGEVPSFRLVARCVSDPEFVADRIDAVKVEADDFRVTLEFFEKEWIKLADETRTSTQAFVTNMLDPFLRTPFTSTLGGRSTFRLKDAIEHGKIVYVNMPDSKFKEMSQIVNTLIKLEFQAEVLRRIDKSRPSFFFCDEFQKVFTAAARNGDSDFFEVSRQSRHANVVAMQNLPALTKQLAQKNDSAMNLLGNCAVKIFLRNTDEETNKFASQLFGQKLVAMSGHGVAARGGMFGFAKHGSTNSASTQYDAVIRQEEFVRLEVPEASTGQVFASTIVHLASRAEIIYPRLRWKINPVKEM